MIDIAKNIDSVKARIEAAAIGAGRDPATVQLVAVSKRQPLAAVQAARAAGHRLFGENFLQEAVTKIKDLGDSSCRWHFIGHLQSNKAREAARYFTMVETVDRVKIAQSLEKHLARFHRTLEVLIQVNVGREEQKAGVLPEKIGPLVDEVNQCPHLRLRGLMTMPPYSADPEDTRPYFRQLAKLARELEASGDLGRWGAVQLSMGMSGDFEVAVEEGATLVRVGTALFGARAYP